jgi:DNA-directed RNA polymerase specialized sigma subunit
MIISTYIGFVKSEVGKIKDKTQRETVRMYFEDNLTRTEIGRRMGFTTTWACKLFNNGIAQLKESIKGRIRWLRYVTGLMVVK